MKLYDHEGRTVLHLSTLRAAIQAAKERWPGCLVLIGPGESVNGSPICIYRDTEDLADEKAAGEIVIGDRSHPKMTTDDVRDIFAMKKSGMNQVEIAKRKNINQSQVSRILCRKSRKDVDTEGTQGETSHERKID